MNMRMLNMGTLDPRIVARIAVTDGMADDAVAKLVAAGHEVDLRPADLDGFDAVVIRSATKMTAEAIASAPSLKLIGRAGVGVDNIDLDAATNAGILVFRKKNQNLKHWPQPTTGMLDQYYTCWGNGSGSRSGIRMQL